ncbi:FKBP-type peptidyl-prolyl cis-trans isomerase [Pontixanthobacter gangjinensis]|uniref:FKBP-type peptidyl-prolyl cis-trans isomerase n=1 Tax=Pontixanthobacter gangjinensis TaxID=1028742 RepID=UPI002E26FD2F|nr:FKBP-type peptidyl-prolyl cis-trans isomerase [Pontixanthobacter gangjinensis]
MSALAVCGLPSPAAALAETKNAAPDYSQDAAWHNAQQAALAERSYTDGWRYIDGGLLWRRVKGNGAGPKPSVADTVTVHYAGTFVDGTKFDSSFDRGTPATFPLGRLIPAWQMAIPQMAIGDTIEIAAPASVAYGPVGSARIPGGATLLFTIELLGIAER